jgi:hypothetical protein
MRLHARCCSLFKRIRNSAKAIDRNSCFYNQVAVTNHDLKRNSCSFNLDAVTNYDLKRNSCSFNLDAVTNHDLKRNSCSFNLDAVTNYDLKRNSCAHSQVAVYSRENQATHKKLRSIRKNLRPSDNIIIVNATTESILNSKFTALKHDFKTFKRTISLKYIKNGNSSIYSDEPPFP